MVYQLPHSNVLVAGLGLSGMAVAQFLRNRGYAVRACDDADTQALRENAHQLSQMDIPVTLGGFKAEDVAWADLVCVSPGIPLDTPLLKSVQNRAVPVVNELELAARYIECPMIAITGSNGKTTVTELICPMLSKSGYSVFKGGNIGIPLIEFVQSDGNVDWVVAEVSSFQLDTMAQLAPDVAVLLNISRDHMDRYPNFEAYVASKSKIMGNQTVDHKVVYNADDPHAAGAVKTAKAQKAPFCWQSGGGDDSSMGAVIADSTLTCTINGQQLTFDLSQTPLLGRHNKENIAAAAMASLIAGATVKGIQTTINTFGGLAHRIEPVREIGGVQYVNDSKATNVAAVIRALEAFNGSVILILGGRSKEDDFTALIPCLQNRVKKTLLIGEAADLIESVLKGHCALEKVVVMDQAVARANELSDPGDTVLLAPGCASFDQYDHYKARGNHFKSLVKKLVEVLS